MKLIPPPSNTAASSPTNT